MRGQGYDECIMTSGLSSQELRNALAEAVSQPVESVAVEDLMRVLDRTKLFRYHQDESVSLMSTAGKVLAAIIEDPTLTQRAISVYLGCSETLVDKTVKVLAESGLITKTKVNRKNVYKIDLKNVINHSDIQHLSGVFELLEKLESASQVSRKYPEDTPNRLDSADTSEKSEKDLGDVGTVPMTPIGGTADIF
jgi:DNA-binding Lrp family transcriptional regulator